MSGVWLQIVLVAVLVLLNAFFAGTETALISLREGQIEKLNRGGRRATTLARLAEQPNSFLATIQIGITLAGFLASATAAVSIAEPLIDPLSFFGEFARPVAIVLVTLVLTYFTLVVGELAPKRVALQRSESWGLVAARPLLALSKIARPAIWLLARSTDLAVRVMGGDPALQREEMTKEELRDVVSSRPGFNRIQRQILSGAFEIEERTLREIVVPRSDVVMMRADASAREAIETLVSVGHTRAPIRGETADEVTGVVHLLDLVKQPDASVSDLRREASFLPEFLPVLEALHRMQTERSQMAIVVDEHGGTEGIVTVEDIMEELVGEIYDEFDRDVRLAQRGSDGSWVLEGSFPMHDLKDLQIELAGGDYTTVAGYVAHRLGRIPRAGDTLEEGPYRLEVIETSGRHAERIRVRKVDTGT
jgi:putative hemolysin